MLFSWFITLFVIVFDTMVTFVASLDHDVLFFDVLLFDFALIVALMLDLAFFISEEICVL